jgi:SM-20-related protein
LSDLSQRAVLSPPHFENIANALAESGWGIFTDVVPTPLVRGLSNRARTLECYENAKVGRHGDRQRNRFVRRDQIVWIDGASRVEHAWLAWANELSEYLNRTLMLGLNSFESHFAMYGPGTFYRRHLDAFRGESNRIVSLVLYLNPHWLPSHGGEFVIYGENDEELGRFPPTLGTLAVFLSEVFPHEVLPTTEERYSLAGWFRPRAELPLENV